MIRFTHEGVEYGLQFRHSEVLAAGIGVTFYEADETRRVTLVDVVEAESKLPVASGMAVCHPSDFFVKDEGRRKALTDAFLNGESVEAKSKTFRALAWKAYFER